VIHTDRYLLTTQTTVHRWAKRTMAEVLTTRDPSSCCNSGEVVVKHWDWQVEPDFIAKKLRCSVTLQATTIKDGAANLVRI